MAGRWHRGVSATAAVALFLSGGSLMWQADCSSQALQAQHSSGPCLKPWLWRTGGPAPAAPARVQQLPAQPAALDAGEPQLWRGRAAGVRLQGAPRTLGQAHMRGCTRLQAWAPAKASAMCCRACAGCCSLLHMVTCTGMRRLPQVATRVLWTLRAAAQLLQLCTVPRHSVADSPDPPHGQHIVHLLARLHPDPEGLPTRRAWSTRPPSSGTSC